MSTFFLIFGATFLTGCSDVEDPDEANAEEVITTVTLSFTPASGDAVVEAAWADVEQDGTPTIDDVSLADGETYSLAVGFLNELETPAEEITAEVEEEGDEHQLFFTGTGVESEATGENASAVVSVAYDDADENGLPVGLSTRVGALGAGSGTFIVTLRHLPPENDTAVKTGTMADTVAQSGFDALPGDTDVSVEFALTVQ